MLHHAVDKNRMYFIYSILKISWHSWHFQTADSTLSRISELKILCETDTSCENFALKIRERVFELGFVWAIRIIISK